MRTVVDLRPGMGPLGGVEALLASGIDDQYLVCPVDIPLKTPGLLRRLTAPSEAAATIFEVEGDSRIQSLPARFSATALEAVAAALDAGRNAIQAIFDEVDLARVIITADEATALLNINTPDDYAALSGSPEPDRLLPP